jgi:hypothetical protein
MYDKASPTLIESNCPGEGQLFREHTSREDALINLKLVSRMVSYDNVLDGILESLPRGQIGFLQTGEPFLGTTELCGLSVLIILQQI